MPAIDMNEVEAAVAERIETAFFTGCDIFEVEWIGTVRRAGVELVALDVRTTSTIRSGSVTRTVVERQSVAYCESAEAVFPRFGLAPERWLASWLSARDDIDFPGHKTFSKAWILIGEDEAAVRRLFGPGLLDHLAARTGFRVTARGNGVLVSRERGRGDDQSPERLLDEAAALFPLLEESARACGFLAGRRIAVPSDGIPLAAAPVTPGARADKVRVTRADLRAFLALPVPRRLPANIAAYTERLVPRVLLVMAVGFTLGGTLLSLMALAGIVQGRRGMVAGLVLSLAAMAVGVAIGFFSARKLIRVRRLLRLGQVASASVDRVEYRGAKTGDEPLFEARLRVSVDGVELRATCECPGVGAQRVRRQASEGRKALVLYLPGNPPQALVADCLINTAIEYDP